MKKRTRRKEKVSEGKGCKDEDEVEKDVYKEEEENEEGGKKERKEEEEENMAAGYVSVGVNFLN